MKAKIVEATNGDNWGKFLIGVFDDQELARKSVIGIDASVIRQRGWTHHHIWVMDLETGEGACFMPGGLAKADLDKHKIWVCPLYEPFLQWLYNNWKTLDDLPEMVELPDAEFAMWGYRRPGPKEDADGDAREDHSAAGGE